jgi:hypothetical protein
MKTFIKISLLLILAVALFIRARYSDHVKDNSMRHQEAITIPAAVKAVVDNKCYGCHSLESRSDDAKKDLMWDSIPLYPRERQIAVLDDISEVLEKGKMPPEKMIEMHPEAAISKEQGELIRNWAETTADELMK